MSTSPVELLRREGAGLMLDLDGTLVHSEPVHQAVLREYFLSRGWDVEDHVVRSFAGRRGADVFATVDGPWRGENIEDLMAEVLAVKLPLRAEPVPGAAEAVRYWHTRGVGIVVVTSAGPGWALGALDGLGLADLRLPMISAADTPVGKPDPTPYRLGAELIGVDPSRCVAAEDTPAGLAAARAAGAALLVGMTTTRSADELLAAGADVTSPDLTILLP